MASQAEMSEALFLEQLIRISNRSISMSLPFILGFTTTTTSREHEETDQETPNPTHGRFIIINPFTQRMMVIEGSGNFDALLRGLPNKDGPSPASKASIEAMPVVEVREDVGECAICLEEWKVGMEAREMPCEHRYHSGCIEKWLRIHGSCPVCRFKMPVDEEDHKKGGYSNEEEEEEEEGRGGRVEREILISFSINVSDRRDSDSDSNLESGSGHSSLD